MTVNPCLHELAACVASVGRLAGVMAVAIVAGGAWVPGHSRAQTRPPIAPPASVGASPAAPGVYPETPGVHPQFPGSAPDLQPAPSVGGWALFGGTLGFFVGGTLGVVTTLATMPSDPAGEGAAALYAVGTTALVAGATVGGVFLLRSLARENAWDPDAGWGAAGVFPGIMTGIALAGGTMLSVSADPATGTRIGVASGGAILGGLLGYALFRQMARPRRGVGWQTLAFWVGFLVGEVVGIVATQDPAGGTPSDQQGRALLFGAAAGGIGAATLAHLIVRATD